MKRMVVSVRHVTMSPEGRDLGVREGERENDDRV